MVRRVRGAAGDTPQDHRCRHETRVQLQTPRRANHRLSLLREGERRIRTAGHDPAWLVVAVGNVEARAFYERVGWSDAGQIDYEAK
jgi:hypothetical protein